MVLIKIFQHIACEGPGYLAELLEQRQIAYELIAIDNDDLVSETLDDTSALVFLGGPMSVNDAESWIQKELALIRQAHQKDLPMLGFCLGSQLICKALGGEVFRGDAGQEIGWHKVERVEGPAAAHWLANSPSTATLFHWHGETFHLPEGADLILSSEAYRNQAYVVGNTLALQCHIEVSAEMVKEWAQLYTSDLAQGGNFNQSVTELCNDLESRVSALREFARPLLEKWLEGVA